MSKLAKRSGGLFGGKHTTLLPIADIVLRTVERKCRHVKNICPGIILTGAGKSGGRKHIKFTYDDHWIQLKFTQGASHQEVCVYTDDPEELKKFIKESLRKNNEVTVSYGDIRTESNQRPT